MTQWQLNAKSGYRFRRGHPWIFAGEFSHRLKGFDPGSLVEVVDAAGKALGIGYGNPHSLIAWRCLSREISHSWEEDQVFQRLRLAFLRRQQLGLDGQSHRLVFSEGDDLPGLVVDVYRGKAGLVVSAQINTAGAERLFLPALRERVTELANWYNHPKAIAFVIHADSPFRQLEGLERREPEIHNPQNIDLTNFEMLGPLGLSFGVDLIHGQKTGFFLDQSANLEALVGLLGRSIAKEKTHLRVLDLFCYLGQWSRAIHTWAQRQELPLEIHLVDSSKQALERAQEGFKKFSQESPTPCEIQTHQLDILKADWPDLGLFDIVICDPPALVKSQKALPQALRAYEKLNSLAAKRTNSDGTLISCSCSGLVNEEIFEAILRKSVSGSDWLIARKGSQSPDHPVALHFPEGNYLKCFVLNKKQIPRQTLNK